MNATPWSQRLCCLALACGLNSVVVQARQVDQLYLSQCDDLQEQLAVNEQRQRQGYRIRQGEAIAKAQTALQQLLDDACQDPLDDPVDTQQRYLEISRDNQRSLQASHSNKTAAVRSSSRRAIKAKPPTRADQPQHSRRTTRSRPRERTDATPTVRSFPMLQVSSVSLSSPYSGPKLMAWLGFYKEPQHCFGIRDLPKIVQCSEARLQARQQFERWWQHQAATATARLEVHY